jgi:hypothetical protein
LKGIAVGGDYRSQEEEGDHCHDGEANGDIPASHVVGDWLGWIYAYR